MVESQKWQTKYKKIHVDEIQKKKKAEEWILGRQCLVGAQGTLGAIMLSLDLSADYTVSAISL